MSSTDSVGGVQETRAQAYARSLEVWGQWLRQWRRTGAPRSLHVALACKQIASERFGAWRAELRADRSARQSMRAARTERVLDQMLVQIRDDEKAIELARGLAVDNLTGALADDQEVPSGSRNARPAFLDG
ncbi:MAG: hypothetical protein WB509_03485 [Acetobacteraceae bacterium]